MRTKHALTRGCAQMRRPRALIGIALLCCLSLPTHAQQPTPKSTFSFVFANPVATNQVEFAKWFTADNDGMQLARQYFHVFDIDHPDPAKLEKAADTAEFPFPAQIAGYSAAFSFEPPIPSMARSRYFYLLTRSGFVPLHLVKRVGHISYSWPAAPHLDTSHIPKPVISFSLVGESATGDPYLPVPYAFVIDSDEPRTFEAQQVPVVSDDQQFGIRNDTGNKSAVFNDGEGHRVVLPSALSDGKTPVTSGVLMRVSGEPAPFLLIDQRWLCGGAVVLIYRIDGPTAVLVADMSGHCVI